MNLLIIPCVLLLGASLFFAIIIWLSISPREKVKRNDSCGYVDMRIIMKQIEFKINNKNLCTEQVIFDIGFPLFFVCIDDDLTRYAVLCIDHVDLKYVIHPTTIEHLLGVLRSEITLREFFTSAKQYWLVKAGSSYDDDTITELSEFPQDALPEDSLFNYSDTEIKAYIEMLSHSTDRNLTQEP